MKNPERDQRRTLEPRVGALRPVDEKGEQEERGDDVGERQRPRDLPLELGVRDGEDRHEEEALDERSTLRDGARTVEGDRGHGGDMVRRAVQPLGRLDLEPRLETCATSLGDRARALRIRVIPSYMTFHRPHPSRSTSASTYPTARTRSSSRSASPGVSRRPKTRSRGSVDPAGARRTQSSGEGNRAPSAPTTSGISHERDCDDRRRREEDTRRAQGSSPPRQTEARSRGVTTAASRMIDPV